MADFLIGLTPATNGSSAGFFTEISGSFTSAQADIEWNNILTTRRLSDNTLIYYAARYDSNNVKIAEYGSAEDVQKIITKTSSGFNFDSHVYGYSATPITYTLFPQGSQRTVTITNANAGALTVVAGAGDVLGQSVVLATNQSITLCYVPANATWYVLGLGGQAGWTTLSKSADQSVINSAALVSDNTLTFPMLASTKYRVRGKIFFDTTAAGDFKYTFTGPASPTLVRSEIVVSTPGAAPTIPAITTAYPNSSGVAITSTSGTTGGHIAIDMIIHNGLNAGNFTFQFAQNTATNDTGAIVRAGSYLEFSVA
jgi:hypothetical protein